MLRKTEKMERTNHEDIQINQIEMGEKIDLSKVTTFPIVIDDVYYFNSEEKAIAFIHSMLSI